VITGGIGKNVGVVTKIREKVGALEVTVPTEPQIAGALGAALIALDRAREHRHPPVPERAVAPGHPGAPS
jgi:activator of 2-hydroxyglutaryl-CoA dehydratase